MQKEYVDHITSFNKMLADYQSKRRKTVPTQLLDDLAPMLAIGRLSNKGHSLAKATNYLRKFFDGTTVKQAWDFVKQVVKTPYYEQDME